MASSEAIGAITAQIVSMLEDIQRKLNGVVRNDELDYLIFQLERIETILCLCMQTMEVNSTILSKISEAKYLLLSLSSDRVENQHDHRSQTSTTFSSNHGRPQYDISKEQLEYLVQFGFKAPQIAMMLGVSEATVRRRYRVFQISSKQARLYQFWAYRLSVTKHF